VRSAISLVFVLALSACSVLDQIHFGGSRLDPNRIYLSQTSVVRVSSRESYRYACVNPPLVCVQHGIGLECRCP
jgi:hypothetical protein